MKKTIATTQDIEYKQRASLLTPTGLKAPKTKDVAGAMDAILADVFAMY